MENEIREKLASVKHLDSFYCVPIHYPLFYWQYATINRANIL
jgi:hypothetical protein